MWNMTVIPLQSLHIRALRSLKMGSRQRHVHWLAYIICLITFTVSPLCYICHVTSRSLRINYEDKCILWCCSLTWRLASYYDLSTLSRYIFNFYTLISSEIKTYHKVHNFFNYELKGVYTPKAAGPAARVSRRLLVGLFQNKPGGPTGLVCRGLYGVILYELTKTKAISATEGLQMDYWELWIRWQRDSSPLLDAIYINL